MSPSRRELLASGGLAATLGLAGCAGFRGPTVVESSTQTYSRGDYESVAVANRNGDVRVGYDTDASELSVGVRKRGRSQSAVDAVTVESVVEDGVLSVETDAEPRFSNVTVRLAVTVPEGLTVLAARTGNGDVTVEDVPGDVTVATGNGDAEAVDVDGYVTVETANGDAIARGTTGIAGGRTTNGEVDVEVFDLREDVSLRSANGDVTARVAPDLEAAVELSVGNGDIEEEVDLVDRASTTDRVTGRLGAGGPTLSLTTGNGDVRLYTLS